MDLARAEAAEADLKGARGQVTQLVAHNRELKAVLADLLSYAERNGFPLPWDAKQRAERAIHPTYKRGV